MRRMTVALAGLALITACSAPVQQFHDQPVSAANTRPQAVHTPAQAVIARQPNIVLVLMDDFSMDLLQSMQHARTMRQTGASYSHAYVVDSLCCVSRTSLATGQYPHQTGVLTNTANTPNAVGPIGGWEAFRAYGNARRSVNVRLQQAGYTTGLVGKFLNQYEPAPGSTRPGAARVVALASRLRLRLRRMGLRERRRRGREHDDPPSSGPARRSERAREGRGLCRHPHRGRGVAVPRASTAATGRRTSSRSRPSPRTRAWSETAHYPADPGFPPAFRDRAVVSDRATAVRVAVLVDRRRGPARSGDDLTDNLPRHRDGSAAEQWRTYPLRPDRRTGGNPPAEPGPDGAVGRPDAWGGSCVPSTTTPTSCSPRTTASTSASTGSGSGKGTPFASDVHVPLLVVGPGVERGDPGRGGVQSRPRVDVRGSGRPAVAAVPLWRLTGPDLR